jgi:Fur family ferric uptake transcriptional regulator
LAARLRGGAKKFTGPRKAVLEALAAHPHPMTIKEVHGAAKSGCDLATVYRTLHLLEGMGLVKRFDFGDGTARFELLAEGDDGHHHHLICTRCEEVVEIRDCFTGGVEESIARRSGFKAVTHKLEFFGLCPGCQRG